MCSLIMLGASKYLDIPPLIGNWEVKAFSILNLNLSDNYYPPGAALALIPFLWAGPDFLPAVYFYYFMSAIVYFGLCTIIPNRKLKIIGLLALPANTYLTWLCLTSADQVVELLTLLLFAYSAVKKFFIPALFFGFFLCFTRPAYWVAYIIIMFLLTKSLNLNDKNYKVLLRKFSAVIVLIAVLLFNKVIFNSFNLSTSSSDTLFYSHQKYHYLTLPKFDMDVFLENGSSTDPKIVVSRSNSFDFVESYKIRATLISIKEDPQRFIFSQIQKLDSYFFPIQKIPNLPGAYQLSEDEGSIIIGNERLTWSITLGHMLFALYRAIWMLLFSFTLVWLSMLVLSRTRLSLPEKFLLLPFFVGVIPGLLFYVETRFKICSELLAVPLFMSTLYNYKKVSKKFNVYD